MPDKQDSCYSCVNLGLCFLHRDVYTALCGGVAMLNLDGNPPSRSGITLEVIAALGAACLQYKQEGS